MINYMKVLMLASVVLFALPVQAERIKDLTTIQGVRNNQLIGYGLVVGLDGSGDQTTQTPFTVQSVVSMLGQLGVNLPPGISLQLKNVAAVMVTATLPPFAKPGQTIDITVSSIGNAKSLRGGTLLMTPLKGADGQIYGMAQGNLMVGGAGASAGGSSVQVNQLSVGRIPDGATVERAVVTVLGQGDYIVLELKDSDFTTASRVVDLGQPLVWRGHCQCRKRPRDPGGCTARQQPAGKLPGADGELDGDSGRIPGEGDHECTHRIGGDEQGGHGRCLCRCSRQPDRDHRQRASGEPAGPFVQGGNSGDPAGADRNQGGKGRAGVAAGQRIAE